MTNNPEIVAAKGNQKPVYRPHSPRKRQNEPLNIPQEEKDSNPKRKIPQSKNWSTGVDPRKEFEKNFRPYTDKQKRKIHLRKRGTFDFADSWPLVVIKKRTKQSKIDILSGKKYPEFIEVCKVPPLTSEFRKDTNDMFLLEVDRGTPLWFMGEEVIYMLMPGHNLDMRKVLDSLYTLKLRQGETGDDLFDVALQVERIEKRFNEHILSNKRFDKRKRANMFRQLGITSAKAYAQALVEYIQVPGRCRHYNVRYLPDRQSIQYTYFFYRKIDPSQIPGWKGDIGKMIQICDIFTAINPVPLIQGPLEKKQEKRLTKAGAKVLNSLKSKSFYKHLLLVGLFEKLRKKEITLPAALSNVNVDECSDGILAAIMANSGIVITKELGINAEYTTSIISTDDGHTAPVQAIFKEFVRRNQVEHIKMFQDMYNFPDSEDSEESEI